MALLFGNRQVIMTVLIGSVVLLAGCSTVTDGSDGSTVELGKITVENSDDAAHTIHVLVERDSEPAYGTAITLEGVSPPANESDFGSIDSAILNHSKWTEQPANWAVYTRVDSNQSWQVHSIPSEFDHDCTSVRLKIEADGSVTSFTPFCASWPPTSDT